MKICHVTSAHNRYDGRIFQKQLTSLAKKYDCYFICCDELENEEKNGVKIVSTRTKFKNRYERFLKANKLLRKKCVELNADVYQFHDSDLLDLALYMKRKNKIVIFDAHEDYEALFIEREWIPKYLRNILQKLYIKKEKKVFPKLDYIICAAEHIKEKLKKYNQNVDVIENFPILKDKIKKENNKENIICFAGGINSTWNHDKVVNAISEIKNIKYLLAGNYTQKEQDKLKMLDGYSKVEMLGKLSYEEVIKLYSKSKMAIALCSYRPNVNYKVGSLGITKIFECMMYELPVIFTDFEVFTKINQKNKFGISVNPYNVDEIKNAIEYLLKNPNEAKKMGENGRKLVEQKYNWSVLEKKIFKIYTSFK